MIPASRRCYPDTVRGVSFPLLSLLLALLVAAPPIPAAAAEGEAAPAPLLYGRIPPDIIVNLRGSGAHYLMVTAEIQTRSQADIENVLHHAAAIRHHMLMSMGEVGYREALTPEGRQQLADEALAIVRRVLAEEAGGNEVEAVLFTSYLVE